VSVLDGFSRRYTVEDMPDYEGKLELVDGRLEVSPPARWEHARIASRLVELLHSSLTDEYLVGAEFGIRFDESDYRQPDVAVVRRDVRPVGAWLAPRDVVLAAEIVSESSLTTDRITKPAQYAAAGIGAYWRVEIHPELELTAYALDPGASVYAELGAWSAGRTVVLERPFPISFEIDALAR